MMNLPLNVDFTDKVVVVTGAGGVICGEMAKEGQKTFFDLEEEGVDMLFKLDAVLLFQKDNK